MNNYEQFQKGGRVSVWVGNFSSDEELDDYMNLNRGFERDFHFELNERDMPESSVESEALSIAQLVDGFSWSESYSEEVVKLAGAKDVLSATTMVIFLNFEYDPKLANPDRDAPLQYLGAASFS